jgi:aspartate/methionine/tyrosine aminotransferase
MTAAQLVRSGYPMQRWVFEDSVGRVEIDLGDSFVPCNKLGRLQFPGDLLLDYGVDRGTARLRRLVADLYGGDPDSVLITHGGQEALFLVLTAVLRPGDQVVVFRPGWEQSWGIPERIGCRVDLLDLGKNLVVDPAAVAAVATDRLRLIVVNTPGNPTGRRVPDSTLRTLTALAEMHDAYVLFDEEYAVDLSGSPARTGDRTISTSSMSKVYGLPGLRVGWLYARQNVIDACSAGKFLTTIANSVLCEHLAADVLADRTAYLADYRAVTETGLAILREWSARNADLVDLVPPQGTPFAWLALRTGEHSLDFCRRVLDSGVLLMPAETLGAVDGVRICFARPPAELIEGLARIEKVLRVAP